MPSYYLETYGCALATYESMLMQEVLENSGYTRVARVENADVIVINTCAVRLDTEQRIAERLHNLHKSYPEKRIVVAGCLAKARPGLIRRIVPRASLISPQNVHRIVEAVRSEGLLLLDGSRDTRFHARAPVSGRIATIMIQEGCRNKCAYCITKVARGAPRSFPPRAIVEQVARSVERGAVEVRLTGTDTAAYGVDLPGKPSLADLIGMIVDRVEGDYRLRIGMMTPEEAHRILKDLINIYKDNKIFKFFHIPVQSGSDKVLSLMGRRYTVSEFKNIHFKIKNVFPESLFATDIIVGHPGESEEDFTQTLELVRELRFERVHIAQYSIRPHTRAASLPQLSDTVKKERSTRLSTLVESIGQEIYGSYVGRSVEALITGRGFRNNPLGRLDNYFPIVIVSAPQDLDINNLPVHSRVLITGASFFDLRGKIVEKQ